MSQRVFWPGSRESRVLEANRVVPTYTMRVLPEVKELDLSEAGTISVRTLGPLRTAVQAPKPVTLCLLDFDSALVDIVRS